MKKSKWLGFESITLTADDELGFYQRSDLHDSTALVRIDALQFTDDDESDGRLLTFWGVVFEGWNIYLEPKLARKLGKYLLKAADECDRRNKAKKEREHGADVCYCDKCNSVNRPIKDGIF